MSLVFSSKQYQTKTFELKGEKCTGCKQKVRITGMSVASAAGEKLPLLAKNSKCFKNVKFLPCIYKTQKNKTGWTQRSSQIGSNSWIKNS